MKFDNLSPELKAKALACKSQEELLALAKEEGYELSDEELQTISGGGEWYECELICSDYDYCSSDHSWEYC